MEINHPRRIVRNTTFLTAAYTLQKILSFLYFIFIARVIGVENVGRYVFALSYTTIFSVFIDLGLSPVLTRESAKDQTKSNDYLNNILGLKLFLSVITFLVAVILINVLNYPPLTKSLVYLAAVIMVLDSFTLSFYGIFRGFQNLKYESFGIVIGQLITIIVGVSGLLLGAQLQIIIIALLASSLFNFLLSFLLLERKIKIRPRIVFDRALSYRLFSLAIPFGIAAIFTRVYGYIDSILLSILAGDRFVGWYSVAYKLTFALQFIPAAFAAAVFPAMSSYYACSKELLVKTFEKAMFYLMIIALPISFGIIALADQIIIRVYGQAFAASIIPLQILISSLIFIFLNFPVGSLLNACDHQTKNTFNMGVAMVINAGLNIILIPRYNFIGASIASVTSSAFLFFLGLYWVPKIIDYDRGFLIRTFIKTLFSSLLMAAWLVYLESTFNLIVLILLGVAIYGLIMYLVGGFRTRDVVIVYEAIVKRFD